MKFRLFKFFKKKKYNLREEVGEYVLENYGEEYVEEALKNYDTINNGGVIGGLLETMSFVHMVKTVKSKCEQRT